MIPQRKIVSNTGKMVLQPHLPPPPLTVSPPPPTVSPPPPTVSPPPPIVLPQNQLHLRAKSLLKKLFQMIQVNVPNFFILTLSQK